MGGYSPSTYDSVARGYSKWLVNELGMRTHTWLFHQLYETEFTWTVERDGNRATNGVYMRDRYSYETGERLPDDWRDYPCSLAEVLASLAFAMEESFLYDPDGETGSDVWMREMLENCGLWKLDDMEVERHPYKSVDAYEDAVDRILNRRYAWDGSGGLFPLMRPDGDQRTEELWSQMNSYVLEKLSLR